MLHVKVYHTDKMLQRLPHIGKAILNYQIKPWECKIPNSPRKGKYNLTLCVFKSDLMIIILQLIMDSIAFPILEKRQIEALAYYFYEYINIHILN